MLTPKKCISSRGFEGHAREKVWRLCIPGRFGRQFLFWQSQSRRRSWRARLAMRRLPRTAGRRGDAGAGDGWCAISDCNPMDPRASIYSTGHAPRSPGERSSLSLMLWFKYAPEIRDIVTAFTYFAVHPELVDKKTVGWRLLRQGPRGAMTSTSWRPTAGEPTPPVTLQTGTRWTSRT